MRAAVRGERERERLARTKKALSSAALICSASRKASSAAAAVAATKCDLAQEPKCTRLPPRPPKCGDGFETAPDMGFALVKAILLKRDPCKQQGVDCLDDGKPPAQQLLGLLEKSARKLLVFRERSIGESRLDRGRRRRRPRRP